MTVSNFSADCFVKLREPCLFLDVDGTLLEFHSDPQKVCSNKKLNCLLKRLSLALDGGLALVSGRPVEDLDRIFSPLIFTLIGQHGLEQRGPFGEKINLGVMENLKGIKNVLLEFSKRHTGSFIEDKGASIALHYRKCPMVERQALHLMTELVSNQNQLNLLSGKMVFEISSAKTNKGEGISRLLKTDPFKNRLPIFIGDDETDETGFKFVNSVGGISIRVGDSKFSSANYQLLDVRSVNSWLANSLNELEEKKVMEE